MVGGPRGLMRMLVLVLMMRSNLVVGREEERRWWKRRTRLLVGGGGCTQVMKTLFCRCHCLRSCCSLAVVLPGAQTTGLRRCCCGGAVS
ncbi:hypothetical protein BKA81DRAFT_351330 [Phyllosticta paracitricarpa]